MPPSAAAPLFPALRNRHLFFLDAALLCASTYFAFAIRYEGFAWPPAVQRMVLLLVVAGVPVTMAIFWVFGLYRVLWRYASLAEVERIFVAAGVAAVASFLIGVILFPALDITAGRVPLSVWFLDAFATVGIVAGPRLAMRFAGAHGRRAGGSRRRAVIAGAGDAGQAVLRESHTSAHANFEVVAFVDDDARKRGMLLGGVNVAGSLAEVAQVIKRYRAHEVIIAIPEARGLLVRRLVEDAKAVGATTRIVPTLRDILAGKVEVSKLRAVEIDDLLRREPIKTALDQVRTLATGKTVIVTGGGGSIGSELCRQLAELAPQRLVVLDHGENAVFTITGELRRRFPDIEIASVIADIRNAPRLRQMFERFQPFAVFHAAAHKHVPLMEESVYEAVTNNVIGTRNVVDAALDADVAHLVLISTDKAVRPTSIMGATKRVAEQIVHHAAVTEHRNFVSVRFGNVLGSSGSVIPIFLEQIRNGGPVTITHPDMRRYFMTIPEAVQLVLQAGAMGKGGELFVLDMGEPVRVADLARDLIRLSGLDVDEIELKFTGVRPGEKITEELFLLGEDVTGTDHPKILSARADQNDSLVMERLDVLVRSALGSVEDKALRELLHMIVPDFSRTDARNSPVTGLSPYVPAPARIAVRETLGR